jgi:alpha-L-arabinofuranosidase
MFKTVSYYVQQLYATNKGTNVLSLTTPAGKKAVPVANQDGQNGLFASACYDKVANEVVVKVVNTSKQEQSITLNLKDLSGATTAKTITLSHKGMDDENSIERPEFITPKQGTVAVEAGKKQSVINDQLAPMSFRIYRILK